MKALIKKEAAPGLTLGEVPIPEYGINDVLIKIQKTAICGTDVHIYNWDEWSQKTIRTPMVIGHEFVGHVAAFGSNVHDVKIGELVSGEGHIVCGRCRTPSPLQRHKRSRSQPSGRICGISLHPRHEHLALQSRYSDRLFRLLRPARQCDAYGALLRSPRRRRPHHRRGADRHHGGGNRKTRGSALCRDHGHQR